MDLSKYLPTGFSKYLRVKQIVFLLIVLINYSNAGIDKVGTTSASFLKLGSGARPEALGGSFVAIADDANSLHWNPAGLSWINKHQIITSYTMWFSDISYSYAGYLMPMGSDAIGLSVGLLSQGDIESFTIDSNGEPQSNGTFKAQDMYAVLSLSSRLFNSKQVSLGVNLKYISQKLDDVNATGFAADVGFLWKGSDVFSFGFVVQNFGPNLKFNNESFSLPLNYKVGIAFYIDKSMLFSVSFDFPIDNKPKLSTGLELSIDKSVSIRTGYFTRFNSDEYSGGTFKNFTGLTLGLGISIAIFNLDYTFIPYGSLGNTHRASLMISF